MTGLRPRSWTAAQVALLGALVAAGVWACWPAWIDIWQQATRRSDAGYVLLVPFVAGYLFWLRRARLRFVRCRPSLWGAAIALCSVGLTWYGAEVDNHMARHLAAVAALVAAVVTMAGPESLRQFAVVAVALLFLLPVPGAIRQQMARPLQLMAASFTGELLYLAGIDAVREGAVLVIRGTPVAVGEACDGMRMVLALALVVFTFVFSVPLRTEMRLLLIGLSPIVALLCNVLRLIPTAIAYGFTSPETAEWVHDVAGWMMLPAALLMLFGVVRLFRWLEFPVYRWRLAPA